MTLLEIREQLNSLREMKPNETIEDYSDRVWVNQPRVPYKELPQSLQKEVRQRFTIETLKNFLHECYPSEQDKKYLKKYAREYVEYKEKLYTLVEPLPTFKEITEGIPEKDIDAILLRTRNIATYTIENETPDNPMPVLYGNFATEAFEDAIATYRERQKTKHELNVKPRRTKATINLASAGYYQWIPSDKEYQHSLTTKKNNNAYIALMNPDFFNKLDFKDGTITYDSETAGTVIQYKQGEYTDVQDLDFPLLTQIYTAAVKSNIQHDAFTITVSLPKFFREMGIEVSKGNAPDIIAKLHSFENCVGIMPGTQTISKLFSIIQLDTKNQTMTFAVPYILKLHEMLSEKNHIERKTKHGELIDYMQPYHNTLVHSTIVKERNKTAVELVYLITTGLLQRGYKPDAQTYRKKDAKTKFPDRVTYSIKFRSLINEAPLLRLRIHSYKDTNDKNKALRRAFTKAYQLLETKTDAKEWFINLECNSIIPTMATIDDELTFTHDGRNGDYKPKK